MLSTDCGSKVSPDDTGAVFTQISYPAKPCGHPDTEPVYEAIMKDLEAVRKRQKQEARREEMEEWLTNGKLSFIKIDKWDAAGVSYVASVRKDASVMEGAWYGGLRQWRWRMERRGEGNALLEETLSPEFSNPPEIR